MIVIAVFVLVGWMRWWEWVGTKGVDRFSTDHYCNEMSLIFIFLDFSF